MTAEKAFEAALRELYPLHRSLITEGTRRTHQLLSRGLPNASILKYPSGLEVGDWVVPQEWQLKSARIEDAAGNVVCDVMQSNLHVVQYSSSLDVWVSKETLSEYVFTAGNPDAIPYVTSYYGRNPGFCMSQRQFDSLSEGPFHLIIESDFFDSTLDLLECYIPGATTREVLLWSYVCHPSLVNNELSGPVVLRALADWLATQERHYSYRLVWSVETIGAIAFLSDHLERASETVVGGVVMNCLGGPGSYTLIHTPSGTRYIDRVMTRSMMDVVPEFEDRSFVHRDSDERQFSSTRAQLPVVGFCKTKPGSFPEYHTSLDDLNYVKEEELDQSTEVIQAFVERLESEAERIFPLCHFVGEPFLSKRDLYPTESSGTIDDFEESLQLMLHFLAFSDGDHSIADIAVRCGVSESAALATWARLLSLDLVGDSPDLPR